jgi:hypothetical protein
MSSFLIRTASTGKTAYFVREIHGWWDEQQKQPVHNLYTLSPDEGYVTFRRPTADTSSSAAPRWAGLQAFFFASLLRPEAV